MGRLFNRSVRLTLKRPLPARFFEYGGASEVITITDLRVTFDVDKHTGAEPNTCEIVVYNLARTTRASLETKPVHVTLEAGYDGQLETLFLGDLRWSKSRPVGTEWETKIQLGDGERAFRHGQVSRSYKGGVSTRDAVREVARSMELTIDPATLATISQAQHVQGLTLSGRSEAEMTRLLAPHGLEWSIQDNRLQILAPDLARGSDPILIAQDTGMIGSPEWAAPNHDGKRPRLNVKCLLKPQLYAGRLIEVQSVAVNGRFKCDKIKSTGDTWGDEFTSSMGVVSV